MKGVKLHVKLVALLLALVGATTVSWQILIQNIPLSAQTTEPVWVIDTHIRFSPAENTPVKVRQYLPPSWSRFITLDESFIARNYGVHIDNQDNNRIALWSARRPAGEQALFYRLMLTQRSNRRLAEEPGPEFSESPRLQGVEAVAVAALLKPIREHSADIETFIREAIKLLNDRRNDNARLLLGNNYSEQSRTRVLALLLSSAHIPVEQVHTLRLANLSEQTPELWVRSYNGQRWLYFNPQSGAQGLPEDRIVWWTGPEPMVQLEGGRRLQVKISSSKRIVNSSGLTQSLADSRGVSHWANFMYSLPLQTQQTYSIVMMIPVGVLLILLLRNIIGIQTLGTFTPVLIGLAFRETGVVWGILFFSGISAIGLGLRAYLEQLHLQLLSRLSTVLTFVVILMAGISVLGHQLGLDNSLSIGLFPMVILTMSIERLSIAWEERGGLHSFKLGLGTLIAATLAHLLMSHEPWVYFIFTFPGTLLVMMAVMLALGHYRGYRLSELLRFKALSE